ncbi:MAG: family 78 glycoside hydrolase catalytic domain [Niabella sp.]
MKKIAVILSFLLLPAICMSQTRSALTPVKLKVEYLTDPKGLDVKKPRFSWLLETKDKKAFNQKQAAYRIVVASTQKMISKEVGDVWDSRWVSAADMSQILFAGAPLLSDRTYYWKVAIKDQDNKVSDWSAVAQWSTGILNDQWKGEWIGGNELFNPVSEDNNIWDPWLRKGFDLKLLPKKATLFVASVGYHELYVNGKRVGDEVLAPVATDHTKRARYVAYEIEKFLKKGKNVIGIWLGTSWSIFPGYDVDGSRPLTPMVTAQIDMYSEENPTELARPLLSLITDGSWKYHASPNKLMGTWDFRNMGGELWDDNKAMDNWANTLLDDSHWQQATVYPVDLRLSAQNLQGNRLIREINPVHIEERPDGSFRVDMGVNFAGWTEVRLKGNPGDSIRFYYSEREQDEMTFGIRSAFIMGKSGKGIFKNRFNYSSGRWITIKGLKEKPALNDIKGWMVRTAYENASHFRCSDTLQNWIYDKVKWTFENLSIGGMIVDCPQRERMGYGGDAHATTETGLLNYQMGAFYTKWMQDWRDVQGTEPMVGNMRDTNYARKAVTSGRIFNNGILPHTAPTYWGGGGPAWGGIVISLPWFMYQHYGDKNVLTGNYQMMKDWLAFLDTHVEDDLMKRFGGMWDFLGDWLWPNATAEGMNNDKSETLCLNNSYRVFNLRTAARIAKVLGDTEQAKRWTVQADRSAAAINKAFYNRDAGVYADGSMANLAAALLAEVVPVSEKEKVIKSLEAEILVNRKGHIHAGITGGALLFRWLREQGRNDLIYSMTSKITYPGWGFMKGNGATTLWEMWEKDLPGHSMLHSSFLYPGAWYIDGLAGIKPDKPGYAQFVIEPPAAKETGVEWVNASFDSPVGLIKNSWKRNNGRLSLSITVPPNSVCLLKLSPEDAEIVTEKKGIIKKLADEHGKIVYELQSGNYVF